MTHVPLSTLLVIRLTVESAERLRLLGLFDVMALPIELKTLYELRSNPHQFLSVFYHLLEQRGEPLSQPQLESLVTGHDVYETMWEAFVREVTDFFHGPMRPVIEQVFRMLELAEAERVASLTATILRNLHEIASSELGVSSGGSPESPELTPDLSHCDSSTIWPPVSDAMNGTDTLDSVLCSPTVTDPSVSLHFSQTTSTPTETLPAS